MSAAVSEEKLDNLKLAENPALLKVLSKEGPGEKVIYSSLVTKINRKDAAQTRVLLITDKALYNILPNNYKVKRRIAIETILALSASTASNEFVVHVSGEYDYRYRSPHRDVVVGLLERMYAQCKLDGGKAKLTIKRVEAADLKCMALTKVMARLQTREDELRRVQVLAADFDDSDKEDASEINKKKQDQSQQQQQQQSQQQKQAGSGGEDDEDPEESKDVITDLIKADDKVRIEDFDLLKVLGRGSFGKVMQVRHKTTGEIFAMKILRKAAIAQRNQVDHTKAERRILEALNHPFLMKLRYAFQSKEKLYFVLDYLQGGELFFHLKTVRRFSEQVAKIYVAEIALALGHLHSLGFVYRDLKPENILLDPSGHLCLTDFGLSKDVEVGDKAHTFCGTPEYLAPEIVAGLGHDKAVDWWSLGILLYELTVGIPPFYDANPNDMYNKIQRGVLRFPPFLTEQCKSLIVGLLSRAPELRLGSKNDVEDIKSHPYYEGFDWDALMRKEIEVAFKPNVASNDDATNFDPTFTSEPVVDSVAVPSSLAQSTAADFDGFTYDPRKANSKLL